MKNVAPDSLRRTRIDPEDLPEGAILIDQTRERTSWEEGMFVTSAQFTRDQSYVIARQSDLGQAIGAGVIEGLEVSQPGDNPTAVVIQPGLGLGGGGESIVLHDAVTLVLADTALQKGLTKTAGLTESLRLISEARTGLFVLCATPVEYTSNPQAMQATSADGQRKLADSVVTEATLFTLVPFSLGSGAATPQARRAVAARRIFHDAAMAELPPSALPLAMLELDGNVLVWLDMHMVRRLAGAGRADGFGLGIVSTPARAAHSTQYDSQIAAMVAAAPDQSFAASDRFDILPPMGLMPAACVAERVPAPGLAPVMSHNWLPAEMPVELTALPEDEIAQLFEESLTLPPIDLRASPAALAQTPVTIIVPIPRANWAEAPLEIVQQAMTLEAAAPLGKQPKTPMQLIKALLEQDQDPDLTDPTDAAPWLSLLAGRNTLWFMRRRQFLRTDALTGQAYVFQTGGEVDSGGEIDVTPPPAPEVRIALRDVSEAMNTAALASIDALGMDEHIAAINITDSPGGHAARASLLGTMAELLRQGSDLAATDLVFRAEEAGALTQQAAANLSSNYKFARLETRFAPFEALLIGGPVEFVLPPFPPEDGGGAIKRVFAKQANGGKQPEPAPQPKMPANMPDLVKRFLGELGAPEEVLNAILMRGGGAVPMASLRDLDIRQKILSIALEMGIPFATRLSERGSVEAQTRRNILARSKQLLRVFGRFEEAPQMNVLFDPVVKHMETMEKAMTTSANRAIDSVGETLSEIARG